MDELADQYAAINLEEEEAGGIAYKAEEVLDGGIDKRWCLVGKFLTDRSIDFEKTQHSMATLWKPGKGVYIKNLEPNLFIFQFNHEVDIARVIEGSPWTYDRMQLVFERLKEGDNPRSMQINKLDFWIQLHDIQPGFMSERVCKDVGNYIWMFLESDKNNFTGAWRDYLRIRVRLQIDIPLKRRMKIKKMGGDWFWVNFKYEHVPTFCFICGLLGYAEKFCAKVFEAPLDEIPKPYEPWMKAAPKRQQYLKGSKWIRSGFSLQIPARDGDLSKNGSKEDKLLRILRAKHHGKLYSIMKEGVEEEIIKWPMFGANSTKAVGEKRMLKLKERLDKFRRQAHVNSKPYKECVKKRNDRQLAYKTLYPP